jgi:hypothetical protein
MLVEDVAEMNPDARRMLDVSMAVALLEVLFKKGEISEKTFMGIKKDAKKIVDTKEGV